VTKLAFGAALLLRRGKGIPVLHPSGDEQQIERPEASDSATGARTPWK